MVHRIRGVSARTRAAVRRVEDERLGRPDLVFDALSRFERVFRQPGRLLNASEVWQPGLEIEDARDDLDEVMRHLPRGARIDLADWSPGSMPNSSVALFRILAGRPSGQRVVGGGGESGSVELGAHPSAGHQ